MLRLLYSPRYIAAGRLSPRESSLAEHTYVLQLLACHRRGRNHALPVYIPSPWGVKTRRALQPQVLLQGPKRQVVLYKYSVGFHSPMF